MFRDTEDKFQYVVSPVDAYMDLSIVHGIFS